MKLFQPFSPMKPQLSNGGDVFAKPNYIYEVKWDGVRGIIHVSQEKVMIFNKNMANKTLQYPEFQQLKMLKEDMILDGEIVVFKKGLPSFSQVLKRDLAINPVKINYLSREVPITYCIFDVLYYQGQSYFKRKWLERREILNHLERKLKGLTFIHFSQYFTQGRELFQAVKEKDMEGVVAKDKDSFYEVGVRKTEKWLKIKYRRKQYCVVCGYTIKDFRPSALLLALYNGEGELLYVGRAGSGLTAQDLADLVLLSKDLKISRAPVINPPKGKLKCIWLEPKLTVLVEFAEWTEGLSLRSPTVKGFSNISPEMCILK